MSSLTTVALGGNLAETLAAIPKQTGVGEFFGSEGQSLLIGRAASLRRWAGSNLGQGKPGKKGGRPKTDLRPIARSLAYVVATSGFHQRLLYERLMAPRVPLAKRRDLKPPAFLRLDPSERFPRVTTAAWGTNGPLHGPFRDRRAADKAGKALHKLYPLRPCDFSFEPDPELPLGLGCLYAQVRSCAAPCLKRVSESDYRALAREAAAFLGTPRGRAAGWLPGWVSRPGLALVVERGRAGIELYPVREGAVLDGAAVTTDDAGLEAAVVSLSWLAASHDDWPWLSAWLHLPRRSGAYLVVEDHAALAGPVREALAQLQA